MGYREEFEADFQCHQIDLLVAKGILRDISWDQDVCPSFSVQLDKELELKIWMDFINPEEREFPDRKRFRVELYQLDSEGEHVNDSWLRIFETDSEAKVENLVLNLTTLYEALTNDPD